MTTHIYMPPARSATKTILPHVSNHRQRASFARQAMFAEFGFRHGILAARADGKGINRIASDLGTGSATVRRVIAESLK